MSRSLRGLVKRIQDGSCVLVLGDQIATHPEDPDVSLPTRLARELVADKDLEGNPQLTDGDDLRLVSQLVYEIEKDRDELGLCIADFYHQLESTTSEFHRTIATLPFRLCITTTLDDYLFQGFVEAGKEPVRGHYNFYGTREQNLLEPTATRPVVFHLYGHPSDLDSLVLTQTDLVDFLVKVIQGSPSLPHTIRGHVGDPDTSFLFVGFGLHHWYLRVLLKVLNVFGHRNKSLALEDSSFFDAPDHLQVAAFFTGDRAIEFKQTRWIDFARQLKETHEAAGGSTVRPPAPPAADAPRVFLCYASDDTETVERLSERLEASGLAIWRDKQSLRGGDKWDRVLMHVIENQVDYVVVAQSRAMLRRNEGYFMGECRAALKRERQYFREGRAFVVPVKLDNCEILEELADHHVVDLSIDQGFEQLVTSIREDWARRGADPRGSGSSESNRS